MRNEVPPENKPLMGGYYVYPPWVSTFKKSFKEEKQGFGSAFFLTIDELFTTLEEINGKETYA